ncbi:glycosyl hydrolase family 28 protein, partial [Noviherbaspirillum sp. ST9]
NKPDPKDPNVIYYGPGIHNISHIQVGSNKTLYVAGGAILRATVDFSEKYSLEKETTVRLYSPSIVLNGNNIKLMGRGIIDGSLCPTHARRMISTQGKSILLQGVIIRDAPTWAMPVQCSENVIIDNLKLIGYRSNSDGINIVSSKKVTVQNCFVRTNDDLVVVKTNEGQGTAEHILVRNCVLWNHLAHALSI